MIYARDKGRMCNNILQYGHIYAWARAHGKRSLSMRFAYKYPYFHISSTPGHNFLRYVAAKFAAKWGWIPVVSFNEPDADYSDNERRMLEASNIVAEGWYVRFYDLFLKYLDEIRELFAFRPEVTAAARKALGAGRDGVCRLGVHIRRGDYARWNQGRFFFSDSQYADVIRSFFEFNGRAPLDVFICGNDPALDRSLLRDALQEETSGRLRVYFPDGNPGEDLCLLSSCDYLIGPPSTFSLVAAMYRDIPLYWVHDPAAPVKAESFGHFPELFRNIL